MTSYKPGQVSALLFTSSNKHGPQKNDSLTKLFSFTNSSAQITKPTVLPSKQGALLSSSKINEPSSKSKLKKKKKKLKIPTIQINGNSDVSLVNTPAVSSPLPHHHKDLKKHQSDATQPEKSLKRKLEKDKEDYELLNKRPRRDRKRDKEADKRTVFVGNCPLSTDKKKLKKLFKEFGEIETLRFRCAPSADPSLPKRAIVITKNFHEQCNNYISYVVFKDEESAKNSLVRNGYLLDGFHLRVDLACHAKKHDKKRSIFVGNLPFTIDEEVIRSHFSDCGEIVNVRIIRDRATHLGKGICYVQFESKDSVGLALKLNETEVQGRKIRVMVCSNKMKQKGGADSKRKSSDKPGKPEKKKISFAPSNVTSSRFQSILKMKKEKRFRKNKKKKDNAKKQDGLSSIFGDMPAANEAVKLKKKVGKVSQSSSTTKSKPHHKQNSFKGKSQGKAASFMGKSKGKSKGQSFKGKGGSFKGKSRGSHFKGK